MKCSIFRNKKKKVGATGVPEVSRVPSGEVMDHHLITGPYIYIE